VKFSEHWLRSFVDPPIGSEELAHRLTMAGLEVEERESSAPPFEGVVVSRIVGVRPHPNADRLTVCEVDTGSGATWLVVCGAPNAASGLTVPYAAVGAKLPGGLVIRQASMRGIDSQGMLCSAKELGLSDDASGLLVLDASLATGADLRRALDLDDTVLTLKLTPNRADCLSIFGLAREVAAITSSRLAPPSLSPVPATSSAARRVRVDDAIACPRFCGRVISGIDPLAPTPSWMTSRLERSGVRSISAVVDVTNYVMLELGQPLHAYDDARLEGDIVVRFPMPGEKLTLLNGQVLDLDPDLLLVADEAKPLGLAGIMGGEHSGIGDDTTRVFLEGAFWNPKVIQGKARRLGFVTDAGFRFERGVDFAQSPWAVERATQLVLDICGGEAGALVDVRGEFPRRDPVRVREARIARILGVTIPSDEIADIFTRLGLAPAREGGEFIVNPPSYRFDLAIEEDFIEEVARLHGYENIVSTAPGHRQAMLPSRENERPLSALRRRLVDRDYQEIITFSFVSSAWERALDADADPIKVLNPIASHLDVMRTTLLGGLLDVSRTNINRQQERVRVFETGACFVRNGERIEQPLRIAGLAYGPAWPLQWGADKRDVDFFDVKGDVEALAWPLRVATEPASHPALHPGRAATVLVGGRAAGWVGELHPGLTREFELPRPAMAFELALDALVGVALPAAKPVSKLPVVRRDIAVVVGEEIASQRIVAALNEAKPAHVEEIRLFDVYKGPAVGSGKKSVAILVLMQDTARTLTDAEIDGTVAELLRVLHERFGATLRQ